MKNEQLLIKDLCERLPYEVAFEYSKYSRCILAESINVDTKLVNNICPIKEVKPYLFPLSSMTEEQKKELATITGYDSVYEFGLGLKTCDDYYITFSFTTCKRVIDYFNRNHFDYNGLIDKGLAIDATGLNIYE